MQTNWSKYSLYGLYQARLVRQPQAGTNVQQESWFGKKLPSNDYKGRTNKFKKVGRGY